MTVAQARLAKTLVRIKVALAFPYKHSFSQSHRLHVVLLFNKIQTTA
jgi:hypothetical protein